MKMKMIQEDDDAACWNENQLQTVRGETDDRQRLRLHQGRLAHQPRAVGDTRPSLARRLLLLLAPRKLLHHRNRWSWSSKRWHVGSAGQHPMHWHAPHVRRTRSSRPLRPPLADSDAGAALHNCSGGRPCLSFAAENSWLRRRSCEVSRPDRHMMRRLWKQRRHRRRRRACRRVGRRFLPSPSRPCCGPPCLLALAIRPSLVLRPSCVVWLFVLVPLPLQVGTNRI